MCYWCGGIVVVVGVGDSYVSVGVGDIGDVGCDVVSLLVLLCW